ncbi:hypothetical protein P2G88_04490 [Aliiglaciecola sp. CAU 1673]|uniref:hypothetical protein n=1 Tax=Aliiglaciecola sp. CAU 1673 TaxID=3032595 RepID=UPI0023D983CB|nr:hypothetical protein [Aliiglaciecola sp. CAU 1673]MDF2177504.1 hypothetical protein [Aliiglaciecola sp. CAU 1673]
MSYCKYMFVFQMCIAVIGCGGSSGDVDIITPEPPAPPAKNERILELWGGTGERYLQGELWLPSENYDAAHVLMVPLHWSFLRSEQSFVQEDFVEFFTRYERVFEETLDTHFQRRLQFFYLNTQFLKLIIQSGAEFDEHQQSLYKKILQNLEELWTNAEVTTYGGRVFSGGMRERLDFKLNEFAPNPEYARAIFDEEFHFLSVSADIAFITNALDLTQPVFLTEILSYASTLYAQESLLTDEGGWLFQPGVWSHYRDYRYAGNEILVPDLVEMILDDIATDSSHLHRMPLWLLSLRDAYSVQSDEYQLFDDLFGRLKWQFENHILVSATAEFQAPRMNNYSDGRNGVYRYNYATVGDNLGYGPYQNSGNLMLSWYSFLKSTKLKSDFSNMTFPLNDNILETYVGPNTTRERNPLVAWPAYFSNGFSELYVLMSQDIMAQ